MVATNIQDDTHHPELQTFNVPFQVPRRDPCTATITVEPNDDPYHTGQDLVEIRDPATTAGFTILKATISSPTSRMYASIYGWVQVTNFPGEPWVMDIYPPFQNLKSPFAMWGSEPTFIDAPNRDKTDPENEGFDFTARTFLCHDPKAAMQKVAMPIFGFEWGFVVRDKEVIVRQLRRLDLTVWNEHLNMFRETYPAWKFGEVSKDS